MRTYVRVRTCVKRSGSIMPLRCSSVDASSISESAPVPVLGTEDMVLHAAAHAGWSGGERLGWLVDVDSVVRAGGIDWDSRRETLT